jgi:hypothetical protein
MKRKATLSLCLILLAAAFAGCRSRTDKSAGTVLLSVSDFTGLPVQVSIGSGGPFQIGTLTLRNFSKDPTGTTSNLQNIEIKSYSITYTRRDTGTRVPPTLVQSIFGFVEVNSQANFVNIPFLLSDQILNPPLSDLTKFGIDTETGSSVIVLDCQMTFFGQTLSGDNIASSPAGFTVEVRQ